MTPEEFIAAIGPAAQASAYITGVPASFTVAQAALESFWGRSLLAQNAMNLFGVKADASWLGEVWEHNTREYLRGQWVMVPARWRKYKDWKGCMDDHAGFLLSNQRYNRCFMYADGVSFAQAVADAGYATDPDYADKLISIIEGHGLQSLDIQETPNG